MAIATGIESERTRRRWLVRRCDAQGGGRVRLCGSGGVLMEVTGVPDVVAAQRLVRFFRRIDGVELAVGADGSVEAVMWAVGHRLPVQRRISVDVALGMAQLGVPVWVDAHVGEGC